LLPHLATYHGRTLTAHKEILAKVRGFAPKGDRLEIGYFFEDRNFSKALRGKLLANGRFAEKEMAVRAKDHFCGAPYLVVVNKDRQDEDVELPPNAKRMSFADLKGMNSYATWHNLYFAAALNRTTKHMKMLEALGITAEAVQRATAHELAHQAIGRTSYRDPRCHASVTAIVPDRAMADRIAALMGAKRVFRVAQLMPAKQRPLTGPQRNRRAIAQNIMRQHLSRNSDETSYNRTFVTNRSKGQLCRLDGILGGNLSSSVAVTFQKHPFCRHPDDFHNRLFPIQQFIRHLRSLARTPIDTKDELYLFHSSVYQPPAGAHDYRRQDYFLFSSFMILDFDGGTLSPDVAKRLFKHRSYLMFNSFSRCEHDANRFRVILFYQQPARSIAEHQAVYDSIVRLLEDAGYPPHESGLDPLCRSGNQAFWVPSTNRAQPTAAFFCKHRTAARDLNTYAIDPSKYLNTAIIETEQPAKAAATMRPGPITQAEIERIVLPLKRMTEGRHLKFRTTARALRRAGCSKPQVEAALMEVAGNIPRLRRKAKGAIKNLA
jgi:hypothetical protein